MQADDGIEGRTARFDFKLSDEAMRVLEALAAKQGPTETDRLRALVRLDLDANTVTLLTDRARLDLPPDVVEPLDQLGAAVRQRSREAPYLLSELLPLLPSTAQTRLRAIVKSCG